ncbi:MAG: thioredoxin family protein [Deltaproteobacteria bacterium]|nr:thioredoxin family protein [Deltaproteobacteria bacterium]
MNTKRKVEVFSAGCPVCNDAVEMAKRIACRDCEVKVLDMNDSEVAKQAKSLGIKSIPAIVIDEKLADCCAGRGPDEASLRAAGLGQPLPTNV